MRNGQNTTSKGQCNGQIQFNCSTQSTPLPFRQCCNHKSSHFQCDFQQPASADKTAATIWIDAEHYKLFHEPSGSGAFGDWRAGYWLRANSLVSSDGQRDGSAAAFIVASRNAVDIWFGLRRDFRTGHDDPVLRETAAAEDDLAVVIGARFGALVIETVQQTSNDASYGQIRLVSSGYRSNRQSYAPTRYATPLNTVSCYRMYTCNSAVGSAPVGTANLVRSGRARSSLTCAMVSRSSGTLRQRMCKASRLESALEWSRSLAQTKNWITWYGTLGAGWRSEQLVGDGALTGEKSASMNRAVLTIGSGLRFDAAELGSHWRLRIQTGLSAWLPVSDADVTFAGRTIQHSESDRWLVSGNDD